MGNQVKTFLLLALMTGVIMFFGQLIGGQTGLIIAFAIALATNFFAYWFSANIVLAKNKARVVGPQDAPELYQLVEHLASNAGLPTPRVAIVDDPSPNAFATGRNPSHAVVAVTRGLLNIMTREELAGVLSHELAHVKHRDILICSLAAVFASVIMLLANFAKFTALFSGGRDGRGGNPIAALLMAFLAPMAAMLIQAAISRSREYLADDGGADIAGTSFGLANALEKLSQGTSRGVVTATATPETANLYIVNPLHLGGLNNLFATHPPIEERIQRLRGMRT
ncbi:MAG: zinc metalloprotease HtpX [Deltaproteobacteria bacterium]|jgi:heat shock protein HtpX|nr:zinc metalloprotease HtpX [Deltaproteobacteria bacterium]